MEKFEFNDRPGLLIKKMDLKYHFFTFFKSNNKKIKIQTIFGL